MNAKTSLLRASTLPALALALALPCPALAGGPTTQAPAPGPTADRSPDAGARAGADAWFEEYIEPTLETSPHRLESHDQSPVLYDPLESPARLPGASSPASPRPEQACRRRAQVGSLGVVVLATDTEPPRGDWSDSLQPEMFRLYFEPLPEPPKPQLGPVPGA